MHHKLKTNNCGNKISFRLLLKGKSLGKLLRDELHIFYWFLWVSSILFGHRSKVVICFAILVLHNPWVEHFAAIAEIFNSDQESPFSWTSFVHVRKIRSWASYPNSYCSLELQLSHFLLLLYGIRVAQYDRVYPAWSDNFSC